MVDIRHESGSNLANAVFVMCFSVLGLDERVEEGVLEKKGGVGC